MISWAFRLPQNSRKVRQVSPFLRLHLDVRVDFEQTGVPSLRGPQVHGGIAGRVGDDSVEIDLGGVGDSATAFIASTASGVPSSLITRSASINSADTAPPSR